MTAPTYYNGTNIAGVAWPRAVHGKALWESPLAEGNAVTDFLAFIESVASRGRHPWMDEGRCTSAGDPDAWFPSAGQHGAATRAAVRICQQCPVAAACLNYALDRPGLQGIWAGTTERQRRAYQQRKVSA